MGLRKPTFKLDARIDQSPFKSAARPGQNSDSIADELQLARCQSIEDERKYAEVVQ